MENNISTGESAAAGEASSKTETQLANGAEALQDSIKCECAGNKKNDTSTSIVPSEATVECNGTETEDNDAAAPIFPPEVFVEILCWLPVRSLAKLQLVCKEWRGFIRGRYLMKRNVDRREVVCHWQNLAEPDDPTKPDTKNESYVFLDGCDGLLLIRSFPTMKFSIWNPATKSVLDLPDPHKDAFGVTFSYIQSTGSYLVVSIYKDESGRESCEVHTPGQSKSWRPLAFPDVAEGKGRRDIQCVLVVSAGETVHTVLILKVGSEVIRKVVSLDLETECFTVNCFTKIKFKNIKTIWAIDWNGKLALTTLVGNNLHVTELEDYKKQRWCEKNKIITLSFLQEGNDEVSLLPLFAKDGNIWFSFKETVIVTYTIETGRSTSMNSRGLPLAGKLFPYKATLVGFQGMHPDTKFRKCWPSSVKFGCH